jgi:hypothetical protein
MNEFDTPEEAALVGEAPSPSFLGSIHVPIGLIALAFIFHFFSELRSAGKQAEIMRWQLSSLDKQTEQLSGGKRELAGLIMRNDEVVRQAQNIQGQYTALFNDLLDLAKEDKSAREVVEKWGIKRTGEPPPAAAPAAEAPKTDAPAPAEPKAPALR